jgi:EpsD family peptidyl-prolyl cis-trans isomerase
MAGGKGMNGPGYSTLWAAAFPGRGWGELKMKRVSIAMLMAATASLTLVACSKEAEKPQGQVVASLDGKDITIHEVNAEINAMGNAVKGVPRKLVEAVALNRVIERKMVANEARARKLDQSPQFVLAKTRNDENLLVQALQADVAAKVLATPRERAQKYITDNPVMFADRRILQLDQIQFLDSPAVAQLPLKEAKTMAAVEQLLLANNIEYRRAPQQIDTLLIDPRLSKEVLRVANGPDGEPFMFTDRPAGAPAPVIYINVVTDTKLQPFIGEKAITYAQQLIQRQEMGKKLADELKRLKDAYKDKITYAAGYDAPEKVAERLKKEAGAGAPAAPAAPAPAAPAAAAPAEAPAAAGAPGA